jgi:hypothetical protein
MFRVGAGVVADVGSLPAAAVGPSLSVAIHPFAPLAIEASCGLWPAQTTFLTDTIGGRIDLLDASLRGCYELPGRIAPGACAGAFVDRLHAVGIGAKVTSEAISVYGGPLASGSVRFAVADWLAARVLLEAAVPLVREPFVVLGVDGTVHRVSAVAVRSTLALEAAF